MAKFQLISQFLKDFSFESPNVPELFFKQDNGQAKLEINVDVQIKGAENNLYMVDLCTNIHSVLEIDNKSIFIIKSTYSGLVQTENDENEDDVRKTLLIKVPQLLFPSIRAMISRATSESGFPTFVMQPIDFSELYEAKNKEKKPQSFFET